LPNSLKSIFSRTKLALGWLLLSALAVAVGGLIFFGWLTDEMSEGDMRGFDDAARLFVHQYSSPALTTVMQIASFLGSTLFLTIFGIGIFVAFWLLKRYRAAALFAITMLGASILLNTLKFVFRRARPEPFFETALPASYSFPSGHSLLSFCFYGVLAAILTARIERRSFQAIIWLCAFLLIALIGLSRVYLGVHYPSDVLAGYTAAFVWVIAVAAADRLLRYGKSNDKEREQTGGLKKKD
jgi:membrane-associated phospholipid phosphatase